MILYETVKKCTGSDLRELAESVSLSRDIILNFVPNRQGPVLVSYGTLLYTAVVHTIQ